MPWRKRDAKKHIGTLTDNQASAWSSVANAALKEYGDEGRAIRTANSQAKRIRPDTGYDSERQKAVANAASQKRRR